MINDPLKLDQHSEFEGFWWLPDKPDEKVPGILRYEPGSGLSLSLIGGFEDRITSSPSPGVTTIHAGSRSWKIIYGMANRREITLIDCVPIKTNGFFWEIEKQIITATLSLVGVYIGDENDSVFPVLKYRLRILMFGLEMIYFRLQKKKIVKILI